MEKITPFLWFEKDAEAAMNFYVDIFAGSPAKKAESKVLSIKRYPDGRRGFPRASRKPRPHTRRSGDR